eukprot:9501880-Alexandrium_andersonii.AAC.1
MGMTARRIGERFGVSERCVLNQVQGLGACRSRDSAKRLRRAPRPASSTDSASARTSARSPPLENFGERS